jgi:ABC-type branched-subunit amino acid transport system ATPase component
VNQILQVQNITKRFSGITAISNLQFEIERGMIKSIIGPNGSGKTTLINLITGFLSPSEGRILFEGNPISAQNPEKIAARKIARTFQTVELFKSMTALENVMVGCHLNSRKGIISSALRLPGVASEESDIEGRAFTFLSKVGLGAAAQKKASNLPLGEQKLLEVARALALGPRLLLLDEPVAGLNEVETARATEMIVKLKHEGITILLVEHDMKMVMAISDEIVVINHGAKIAEGDPAHIQNHPAVIEAYLGSGGNVCS